MSEIEQLRNQGLSVPAIAKQIGISEYKVRKYLRAKGFDMSQRYRTPKLKADYRIFQNIDTQEKAYWLGMMYADGSLTRSKKNYQVTLCLKDKEHIEKYKQFLGSDHKIYHRQKEDCWELTLSSQHMFQDLHKLGCTIQKSHTIKFPVLEEKYLAPFMLGYFDGDGYIGKEGTNVFEIYTNSLEFISEYQKILCEKTGATKNKIYTKSTGVNTINFYGMENIRVIYNFLYSPSYPSLDRKRELFIDKILTLPDQL